MPIDPRLPQLQAAAQAGEWEVAVDLATALLAEGIHGEPAGVVQYTLGKAQHGLRRFDKATHAFVEARNVVAHGSGLEAQILIAMALNWTAYGGHSSARGAVDEFFTKRHLYGQLEHLDGVAYQILGVLATRAGNLEEAAQKYRLAAESFTDLQRSLGARIDEAGTLADLKRTADAEAVLQDVNAQLRAASLRAADINPQLMTGIWLLDARIEEQRGQFAEAVGSAGEAAFACRVNKTAMADPFVRALLVQARCLKEINQLDLSREKAMVAAVTAMERGLTRLQREAEELYTRLTNEGGTSRA